MSARRWYLLFVLMAGLGLWACDSGGSSGTTSDAGGDSGSDATAVEGCDVVLTPSNDAYAAIQQALIDTPADSVICFQPGTYAINEELSLTTRGITLRGLEGGDVVFDFAGQQGAPNGLLATGSDFTVENLSLRNSPGDGIRVEGAENVIFRNIDVRWDGEPSDANGAYAIYPVTCTNVLIENSEVYGASDAGVYVGQSSNVLVRNNEVHGNVAGIEIENTTGAEVTGNHSYDNAAGILVFNLPNLPVHSGSMTRVHDNTTESNNRENFATEGTTVSVVPTGLGIMVMAVDDVEVDHNTIQDNDTTGVLVVSYLTARALGLNSPQDPLHDPYPETIFIHDNTYVNDGNMPLDGTDTLLGVTTLEDILWDGIVDTSKPDTNGILDLCIQEAEGVTFRDFNVAGGMENQTTDISAHDCTHDPVPSVVLPFAD